MTEDLIQIMVKLDARHGGTGKGTDQGGTERYRGVIRGGTEQAGTEYRASKYRARVVEPSMELRGTEQELLNLSKNKVNSL